MEYLAAVDEKWRFLAHRSLTPLEWGFAEALEKAGVPLGAVLEGLCLSFERFHAGKLHFFNPSPGRRQIRTFMYCLGTITDKALEMYPDTYWQARRAPDGDTARRSTPSPESEREKGEPKLSVPHTCP